MGMNDRRVATFIQDMLHLKPHEEHELERPLAFLLPHSEDLPLSPSGRELNKALQGYKRDLLNKLKDQVAYREQQIDRFHEKAIQVIVSDSGTGKTFLLARTIALLLDLRAAEDDEYQIPEIGFSQLKSYRGFRREDNHLLDVVLSSTHIPSPPSNIDAFRQDVGLDSIPPGERPAVPDMILFIDSLDEVQKSFQLELPEADQRLREKGILPIWAIRRLEFENLKKGLVQVNEDDFRNLISTDGGSDSIAIELELNADLEKEVKEFIDNHEFAKSADDGKMDAIRKYLKTALKKYQLLHKPRTNLSSNLSEKARTLLFHSILDGLIQGYIQIYEKFETHLPENLQFWKRDYDRNEELERSLVNMNLCLRIVNRFSEQSEEKIEGFSEQMDDFYQHLSKEFERNLDRGHLMMSDRIPAAMVSECRALLYQFWRLGLVVGIPDGAEVCQFAHRDITATFYLNSLKKWEMDANEQRDIQKKLRDSPMFSPFLPPSSRYRGDNGQDNRIDFHRRNGDVLKYIPPLLSQSNSVSASALPLPWNGLRLEQLKYEDLGPDQGFNQKQRQIAEAATKEYDKQCVPLIIHGPPGTGKTWLAVERMLGTTHGISTLPGFIVTLNATLARAHLMDLEEQHSDGVVMRKWDYQKRVDFLNKRIRVEGLEEILFELASEDQRMGVLSSRELSDLWGATCRSVSQTMGKGTGNLVVHYNRAVFDYRNLMFDQFGPQLNSSDKWQTNADERAKESLWHTPGLDDNVKKRLCETWLEKIRQQLNKDSNPKTSLTSIAATAVQRMLAHELRTKLPGLTAQEIVEAGFNLGWELGEIDRQLVNFGRRLYNLGPAGSMVIDEVQDMTPIEVVVLTLLVEFEEHESHRIMLAGDEYQTINGNDFSWNPWLYRLKKLCEDLLVLVQNVYKKKSRTMGWHRLQSLANLSDIGSTPPLTEVRRNKAEIVGFFTKAWRWDLAPRWKENDIIQSATPFRTKEIEKDAEGVQLIHLEIPIQTDATLNDLVDFIKRLSGRGNLSVIIPDGGLRDALVEMLGVKNDSELFIYDPFTIKGLEQDIAVVIGGYAASSAGEFSMLVSSRDEDSRPSVDNLFDRINRYMLVSNSRARNTLITVNFDGSGSLRQGLNWRQFAPPQVISDNISQDVGLGDALDKLEHRPEEWAIRSFAELQKLVNRGEQDARYHQQIERVREAWTKRASVELSVDNLLSKLLHEVGAPKTTTLTEHVPVFAAKFLGVAANDDLGRLFDVVNALEEQSEFIIENLAEYLDLRNELRAKVGEIERATIRKSQKASEAHSDGGRFSSNTRLLRLQTDILKEFSQALTERDDVRRIGLLWGREDDDFAVRWVSSRKIIPARLYSDDVTMLTRHYLAALHRNPNSDVLAGNIKDMMSQSVASLRNHRRTNQSKSEPKNKSVVAVCRFAKELLSGDSRWKLLESPGFERDVFEFHSYARHQSNVHPFGWWDFVESEIKSRGWNALMFSKVRHLFEGKDTNVRIQIIQDVPYWRKKPHIVALAVDPETQLVGSSLIQSTKDAQDIAKDALGKLLFGAMDTSTEWLGHNTATWEDLLGDVGRILLHASDPPQLSNIVGIFAGHHSISVKGERGSTIDVTERLRFAASMLAMNFLKEKLPRRSERSKVAVAYSIPDLLDFIDDGGADSVAGLLQQLLDDLKTANCETNEDLFRIRGSETTRLSWQPIFTHVRNVFITQLLERHNIHCKAERPVQSGFSTWLAHWLPSSIDASGVAWPDLDEEALQSTVGFESQANRFHAENLLRDRPPVAVHDKMYIGNPIQFGTFTAPRHVAPLLEQQKESYWVNDRLYLTVTDPRVEKWIHTVADLLVIGIEDDAFRNNWNSLWTFLLENGAFEQFGKGREDGDVDSVSIAFTEEAVQKARQIGNQSLFDVYPGTAEFSPLDHVALPDWFRRHPTIINVVKFEGTGPDTILKRL